MAAYSLVTDMQTQEVRFAIVADDTTAKYVFPQGRASAGLDDARVQRLAKRRQEPPAGTADWIRLAGGNLGYYRVGLPVETASLDEAVTAATQALADVL